MHNGECIQNECLRSIYTHRKMLVISPRPCSAHHTPSKPGTRRTRKRDPHPRRTSHTHTHTNQSHPDALTPARKRYPFPTCAERSRSVGACAPVHKRRGTCSGHRAQAGGCCTQHEHTPQAHNTNTHHKHPPSEKHPLATTQTHSTSPFAHPPGTRPKGE
jgi:hypothetical protein